MKEAHQNFGNDDDEKFAIKGIVTKYLRYWPWFLIAVLLSLFSGYLFMRYATVNYRSAAKIKIIDESKRTDIASEEVANIWGISTINLDNEIEVLKSYRLLNQVVEELNLDVSYYYVGFFKTSEKWNAPFVVKKFVTEEEQPNPMSYEVELNINGFDISDDDGNNYQVGFKSKNNSAAGLPFSIELLENVVLSKYEDVTYKVVLNPRKKAVQQLANRLQIQPTNKKSDILALWTTGESIERSEAILNTVIAKFNEDAISDVQAISKRTLDFIDERFIYLSGELDSIELGKAGFKRDQNLAYIEEDATSILKKKSEAETEAFSLETQISLSQSLKRSVARQADYGLLPADIGLDNTSINSLVKNYNELARERTKLLSSVQESHPSIKSLNTQLSKGKENILKTVDVSQRQLRISLNQLNEQKDLASEMFSRLPENEKMLRGIERQQSIKEKLFLLLLQKREEAAINNAVTAPSVKIVDYAVTPSEPISPKKVIVYPLALLLGLFIPFTILFLRFSLDTKVQERSDVERLNSTIPIMAEIPFLEKEDSFKDAGARSLLAESFRILSTNISFHLPKDDYSDAGKVIYIASAIKGEGKTTVALNLSLAYASLNKKVLLVGADLRNPQLHAYFGIDKNTAGLSDFLFAPEVNWENCIHRGYGKNPNHNVCFSGTLPTNPPELLAGRNFKKFIERAKKEFDYVIVDTAPTILVTDTLLISEYADLSLFVVRLGFTDKRLIEFSKDLKKTKKLTNVAYVLNDVGLDRTKEYNYGYGYGYSFDFGKNKSGLDKVKYQLKDGLKRLLKKPFVQRLLAKIGLKL